MNAGDVVHRTITFGLFTVTMGLAYFTAYESAGIIQRRVVYKQTGDQLAAPVSATATAAAATAAATKK